MAPIASSFLALALLGCHGEVRDASIVQDAISRAAVHPTVVEVLGEPQTVHTWVTTDTDVRYWSGGTSKMTSFWRPGVTILEVDLLTTIDGPKGSAYFSVSGRQDLATEAWRDIRMEVYGSELGDVESFRVDLTQPDQPGTVVRR